MTTTIIICPQTFSLIGKTGQGFLQLGHRLGQLEGSRGSCEKFHSRVIFPIYFRIPHRNRISNGQRDRLYDVGVYPKNPKWWSSIFRQVIDIFLVLENIDLKLNCYPRVLIMATTGTSQKSKRKLKSFLSFSYLGLWDGLYRGQSGSFQIWLS